MSRNYELDSLKSREQDAFQRKQVAFQKYQAAKKRTDDAYDAMQSAWNERVSARNDMNREYEEMQRSSEHYRAVWDEYARFRDYNNSRIESLKYEADREHEAMKDCFDRASAEYEYGDKSMAPIYSREGHEHKDRRDELNAEVSDLVNKIREARQTAEYQAPKTDSSAFYQAKEAFNRARSRHESAKSHFQQLKAERDGLKAEFDALHAEHGRLKAEFQRKLEEVKAENKRERERVLDKAGIRYGERADAKIVKKSDGTLQIYHGGLGKGDGLGHGHTVLDQSGKVSYNREAFAEHGKQNYSNNEAEYGLFDGKPAKIYPDKRKGHEGWYNIIYSDKGDFKPKGDHGHILVNEAGSVIYWRDQGQEHGEEYFIDDPKSDHTKG